MTRPRGNPDASPHCPICGYNLHGLPSLHCPECGHKIQSAAEREYAEWLAPANAPDRRRILLDRFLIVCGLACFVVGAWLTTKGMKALPGISAYLRFRSVAGSTLLSLAALAYYYYCEEDMVRPCVVVGVLWLLAGLGLLVVG
ncbi:MAG: hypothetical protein DCC65_08020 [Planctomycetota bacterium]|nr:MAG: hypothetical protein DCC65_08020 [Planctomycetota bacterium]